MLPINADWKCSGCFCNHGRRVRKFSSIGELDYCEQTYFRAAEAYGESVDKLKLALKYGGKNGN